MFKTNRLIFREASREAIASTQSIDMVEMDKKVNGAEGIAEKKETILAKINEITSKRDLTNTEKLNRLKKVKSILEPYKTAYGEIKSNGMYPSYERRMQHALAEISKITDKIDEEIRKLEQPARAEVKEQTRKEAQRLKAETPRPELKKPTTEQSRETINESINYKEAIKQLNWRNIGNLDEPRIKSYFTTIKQEYEKASRDNLYEAQNILRQIKEAIFPPNEYSTGMFYSDIYANGEFKTYVNRIKNKQSAYGRSYTTIDGYLRSAKKNNKLHNLAFTEYANVFGKINWNATSYMFTSPLIGAIPAEKTLSQNHIGALDVFFNPVEVKGKLQIGPDVKAIASGVVIAAGDNWTGGASESAYKRGGLTPKGGNVVITFNPHTNEYHYYSHMATGLNIKIGDFVEAGTVIGKGGNTGGAITDGHGNHVHFEIHKYDSTRNTNTPYNAYELRHRLVQYQKQEGLARL